MKINASSLCIAFLLFYPVWLPWQMFYISYFVVDCYLLIYIYINASKSDWYSNIMVLSVLMIIMNTYNFISGMLDIGKFILGFLFSIFIYALERVIFFQYKKDQLLKFIHQINLISIIANIISSISVLVLLNQRTIDNFNFFLGDKFLCSYALILGIVLLFADTRMPIKERNRKKILIVLISYSIIYDIAVNCMTAIIMTIIVGITILIPAKIVKSKLRSPIVSIVSLIIAGTFPIWSNVFLKNEKVQYMITEIMNKNISLTGRTYIYGHIRLFVNDRIWCGYGYNNSIVKDKLSVGNIQNGILDILLSYGIIVMILFALIVVRYMKGKNATVIFWGITFAFIVISSIEVTFSTIIFFFSLFMCHYYCKLETHNSKVKFFIKSH